MKFDIIETKYHGDRQKQPPHKKAVAIPDDDIIEVELHGFNWEIEINTIDELLQLILSLDDTGEIILSHTPYRGRRNLFTIEIYNGFRE